MGDARVGQGGEGKARDSWKGRNLKNFFNEQFLTEYAQFVDEVDGGDGDGDGDTTFRAAAYPIYTPGKRPVTLIGGDNMPQKLS